MLCGSITAQGMIVCVPLGEVAIPMRNRINRFVQSALRRGTTELLPGVAKSLLKAWTSEPVYPIIIQMEPTRRCNLRCVMCALTQFYHKERAPDMSLDEFKHVVSQFPGDAEQITIQGTGEPLLNKDIIEMIEFARARGFRTHFNTNLIPLTDEMAERLVAAGHDEVMVSIETTNPERYADIRRNATIERFLENMGKLARAKERAGTTHPKITACSILMKHTLEDIPEMVSVLKSFGVVRLHFADMCTYPEHDGPLTLADGTDLRDQALGATMSQDEIWEEVAKIKALEDETFELTVPGEWGDLKMEKSNDGRVLTCKELWRLPFVKPDSTLATCCWAPQFVMGDFKTQSFREIWFGEQYRDMRLKHLTNRHPDHCRQCQQLMYTVAQPSRIFGPAPEGHPTDEVFMWRSIPTHVLGDTPGK